MQKFFAIAVATVVAAAPVSAQQKPPVKDTAKVVKSDSKMEKMDKMDHAKMEKMEKMDHAKMEKMEKMDHSKMDDAKMKEMDHSRMKEMDHSKMEKMEKAEKMDHSSMDDHAASGWKELDSLHMLLMATYHPVAEQNDVGPARLKAAQLSGAARTLAASQAPARCDSPELRNAIQDLVAANNKVAALAAQSGNDAAVATAMKAAHEKFEVVEKRCASH